MNNNQNYNLQTIPAKAGIGLRSEHYEDFLENASKIEWCEVHPDNYFGKGGKPHYYLDKIRQEMPISFHGVGLSIGSADELSFEYLAKLKDLIDRYEPDRVSDHVSWSSFGGVYYNDLLPIPYTKDSCQHLVNKINQVQDFLGRQFMLENASTYLEFENSDIPECEFMNMLADATGCATLLDVNNVYVTCQNHGLNYFDYIRSIDMRHVNEMHLAGHTYKKIGDEEIRIDTHDDVVCNDVWDLYSFTLDQIIKTNGQITMPSLIEWDADLPEINVLLEEANKAQSIMDAKDECRITA